MEDPESDEARLIYADYLEESGDPRGEFIRVQCQLNNMTEDGEGYLELYRRQHQLLKENSESWIAGFGKLPISKPVFERGFVVGVTMTAKQLARRVNEVADKISLLNHISIKSATKEWETLSSVRLPSKIKSIALSQCKVYTDAEMQWKHFLDSNFFENVTRLDLHRVDFSPQAKLAIAQSGLIGKVEHLDYSNQGLHDYLDEFLSNFKATKLLSLSLDSNRLSSVDVGKIANCESLTNLQKLSVSHNALGGKGVAFLANSLVLKNLKVLSIKHNRTTDAGLKELADPQNLPSLEVLEIWDPGVSDDVIAEVCKRCRVTKRLG